MKRVTQNDLAYYQFDALDAAPVAHGIFTRLGGVSTGVYAALNLSCSTGDGPEPVQENRRRMLDVFDLTAAKTLTSWLVHGNHVRVVSKADAGYNDVYADGMVTAERGLALTLRFADCVPVMFYDRTRAAIGIAHAGWQGIVNGVLGATLHTMRAALGCALGDVVACVGPSIGPTQFEVGPDVAERIQAAVPVPVIRRPANAPKPFVDLWGAAEAQLRAAGAGHVEVARICTASNTAEWFSHRAEHGQTGRFGALIQLQ